MSKFSLDNNIESESGKESKGNIEEPVVISTSSSSVKDHDSIDFDNSSMKCFKEIKVSSSSIFKHPLYYFPELQDTSIFGAFRDEPPIEIDNDVGIESYQKICKQLNVVPLRRVLESLENELLDLRYYGLRRKELKAIFHVLEQNAYVKILLLQDSWMDEESVRLMSNMLTQNESILTLDLNQCQIGAKGAQALNEGLQSSLILQELNLSHNFIGDEGLCFLQSTFKNNESLKKINLGHNNLTSGSAGILQQFFISHDVIEDVNLEWNILGNDDGFKKIAAGLKANSNIRALNLSWNNLQSIVVAKELNAYIRESTTLVFLDLSNNGFRGIPAAILRAGISASTTLKNLKLGNNPLHVEDVAAFGIILLQSETLETLDLENLFFHKSFNSNLKKIKKAGKTFIYGGVLENFKIKGPKFREVLLRRCHYLGLAPKKAKAKRDFGHIALNFPEQIMEKAEFEYFIRKKKKGRMYDEDLLAGLSRAFSSQKTKVDTKSLLSEYMRLYPDTILPPLKPKKEKKGRRNRVLLTSITATSTKTNVAELKISFVTSDQLGATNVPSSTEISTVHGGLLNSASDDQTEGFTGRHMEMKEEKIIRSDSKTTEGISDVKMFENVEVLEKK